MSREPISQLCFPRSSSPLIWKIWFPGSGFFLFSEVATNGGLVLRLPGGSRQPFFSAHVNFGRRQRVRCLLESVQLSRDRRSRVSHLARCREDVFSRVPSWPGKLAESGCFHSTAFWQQLISWITAFPLQRPALVRTLILSLTGAPRPWPLQWLLHTASLESI